MVGHPLIVEDPVNRGQSVAPSYPPIHSLHCHTVVAHPYLPWGSRPEIIYIYYIITMWGSTGKHTDCYKQTDLHGACVLLKISRSSKGTHGGVKVGNVSLVESLLRTGADVSARDSSKRTHLHTTLGLQVWSWGYAESKQCATEGQSGSQCSGRERSNASSWSLSEVLSKLGSYTTLYWVMEQFKAWLMSVVWLPYML